MSAQNHPSPRNHRHCLAAVPLHVSLSLEINSFKLDVYLQPLHIVSDLAADTAPVYFIEDRISPAMLYWDSKYLQMKQQYFHSEILHYIYETKHPL